MKLHQQKKNILNAESKFSQYRDVDTAPIDLSQLDLTQIGDLTVKLFNDKNLEVSKVRPFIWSLVETYVDRFQLYPFDAGKALFNDLELNGYPEDVVKNLVKQLEARYEKEHGRPLRKSTQLLSSQDGLDDEIKTLRDSLKYAAMVAECDD